MKKSELEAEIVRLKGQIDGIKSTIDALIKGGLQFQHQFQDAYFLLKGLTGCSSHPQWLEIQAFLGKFDVIDTTTYGKKVVPK